MKKTISLVLFIVLLIGLQANVFAESLTYSAAEIKNLPAVESAVSLGCQAKSVVLMEAKTGKILYAENENTPYPPASVTKVMTLLLTMEAVKEGKISLSDPVSVSAHAASMGGSQVFLEEGETLSVEEMIKCCVISSANDCAVALAEFVGGSEEHFVARMNERAEELGMKNTHFENVTGLDDTVENHVTSALDIALMSRELIGYEVITKYGSLWQDTIRNGEFTLTNTNRLVRFYDGCNGLKTGSTAKAGYCVSAAAKRDGLQLIAVVMGSETRDERNETAKKLLDYGFANDSLFTSPARDLGVLKVSFGTKDSLSYRSSDFFAVVSKGKQNDVSEKVVIPDEIKAPVKAGDTIGKIEYSLDGEKLGECEIVAAEDVEQITFFGLLMRFVFALFGKF